MSSTKPLKNESQTSSSKPLDRLRSIKGHLSPGSQDPSPFLRNTERPKYIPEKKPFDPERPVKAVIVGAGIAGIATSILLSKKVRNLSYTLYDKNASVGGTWAENIYPGVRCDVPSHAYQLTFEPNPHWTEFYAEGPEIHKYYESVVEKYGVTSHLKLRHQVVRAVWSQDDSKWLFDVMNLETGEVIQDTADFFISAIGRLNQWAYPNIPGLEDVYEGHLRHTSNWDTEYDYSGKRVAVIGNGASGMQIVPNILPTVAHLEHYIRSKVWISPTFRGGLIVASADNPGGLSYSAAERAEFEADPAKYLAYRKALEKNFHGGFLGGILGSKDNEATKEVWRKTMSDRVGGDPEWLEKLVPDYAPGCKRPTPAPGYLEALLDPKTTFHSSPIVRATKKGLVTADGNESQVDAIIAATGHANSFVPRFPIINQNNVNLQETWSTEGPIGFPETYFGIMAPGFPNYFFVMQANGNGAGGTVPLQCELSATYIAKAIRKVQSQSYSSLTPTEQATDDFNAIVNAYFDDKAAGDNCNSWFKQGKGNTRNLIAWPGTAHHRLAIQRDPRWEDFEYSRRKGAEKNLFEYFGNGWTERERKEDKDNWTNYLHEVGKIDLETLHENWNE